MARAYATHTARLCARLCCAYARASMILQSAKKKALKSANFINNKGSESNDTDQKRKPREKQTALTAVAKARMTTRHCRDVSRHVSTTSRAPHEYPLKEVIHPHVPVGIPCYDFTPVAVRSVGGCLHCWLAHRLRVQTTPMV